MHVVDCGESESSCGLANCSSKAERSSAFSAPTQRPGRDCPQQKDKAGERRAGTGLTEFLDAGLVLDDRLSLGEALSALFEVVQERLARLGLAAGCSRPTSQFHGSCVWARAGFGSSGRCKMPRGGVEEGERLTLPDLLALLIECNEVQGE